MVAPAMVELDLSSGWRIAQASPHPTAALAARELDQTLARIAGAAPAPGDDALELDLRHGAGDGEGLAWDARPGRVELRGDGPRGLLYAAYDFLEALSVRWPWPGAAAEHTPAGRRFGVSAAPVRQRPGLPGRCLVLGHRAFLEQAEDWIVWAARNRLNAIFVHVSLARTPVGAAPEDLWLARRDRLVALVRERGMTLEHGGHLLPELLAPRMPRPPVDDPDAAAAMRRSVEAHVRAHPEVDVFHIWGGDVAAGGNGKRTGERSPSDRALLLVNHAADALADIAPSAQLSFLAYHDTEPVPGQVAPRPNVCLLWAPRERCYAHAIDDARCPGNVPHYRDTFRAQVDHFRSAGAAPAHVFEYYLDGILFGAGVPPLGGVMRADLLFYADHGAHTVQALMTGSGAWPGPHPNPWVFARLSWDATRDSDALLEDFCEATHGPHAGPERAERYRRAEASADRALARHHAPRR